MMLVRTYISASSIEGMGVHAGEAIAKGQLIWTFEPAFDRLIDRAFYDAAAPYMRDYLDRYAYPFSDDPEKLVLEVDNGRFMNHADDPNTDYSTWGEGRALKDIAPGEELTCDYAGFYNAFELMPSTGEAKVDA